MSSRLCGGREDGTTPVGRPVDEDEARREPGGSRAGARPVRVVIADEQRLFVEAIEIAIATEKRLTTVGHAFEGMELIRLAASLQPEVLVVQTELPWLDGFAAMHHLRLLCPESRVVLVSESGRTADHARALTAGAVACVSKREGVNELVETLLAAAQPPLPALLLERAGRVLRF
jgi:DNA-binding NarL/FixJ family response regulator